MPGAVTAGRLVDDRYRLLEPLEEGGMGILWRAEDLISERYVTVKELRFPDPLDHMQRRALAARVRREARAMAAVQHPGLARIVDVVDDLDRPWVVSEFIDHPTLADRVRRDGPLPPEEAAALGLRLLDVLEAATDHDMVHRFLQPSKVFVGPEGEVRVADFGIASLIGDATVARDGAVGNVSFMSPEQAGTREADIWSLGAVLYFAVEGVAPFGGGTSAAILEAVASQPPRPPERAGALARVLAVTLQKDPSERPASDELRTLLEVAAGPLASQPQPEAGPERPDADEAIVWGDPDGDRHRPMDLELGLDLATDPSRNGDAAVEPRAEEPAAEPEEPAEPPPPAPPLPPKVALERMFMPDPGAPPVVFTPEEEHREPPEPWPVPRKKRKLTVVLSGAVVLVLLAILFTNGREILTREARDNLIVSMVDWDEYVDPDTGFRIEHPSDWRISRDGQYTDFRHPNDAAALRVVVQDANGRTAVNGWIELERRFRQAQPSYSRIRLEPTEFRGYDAAEWEFTYSRNDVQLHNLDLGVVTGTKTFTLNFESRARNWSLVQPFVERFESSFVPPKT
ncbi:MAG TPA: serine/threonine-protein kinase [Acidimicrobiales bacterium]|nr:serine/threonine-protein kinase [Acidimicrobiales bacterium]